MKNEYLVLLSLPFCSICKEMCVWGRDTEFVKGRDMRLLRLKIREEVEGDKDN